MIVSIILIVLFAGSTAYLAYNNNVSSNKLQDYIAKYESVKQYAEHLTKEKAATAQAPKQRTAKKAAPTSSVVKRGRKPKAK